MPIIPIKQAGRSLVRNRSEALDSILSFLFLAENREDFEWIAPWVDHKAMVPVIAKFNKVPLCHFDGADVSWMYESLHNTLSYQRLIVNPFCSPGELKELQRLPGDWDITIGAYYEDVPRAYAEQIKDSTYLFSVDRFRTVPLKTVRGLFKLRSGIVVEKSEAHVLNNGTYISDRDYNQYFGGAWHTVGVPFEIDPPDRLDDEWQNQFAIKRSMALTAEYDWSVHVGFNVKSVPSISIPSDPVGARDVFKLRDVPPGKGRRDALKHWVKGHTRKAVEPDYVEKHIWPYLRGAEEFTWQGLYCKIQPSIFDLRKAREYQQMSARTAAVRV